MKKILKENKAITLIALVITIVVLIILAAVAINLSLGNNGIFNRAKTAKEQYQNAELDESRTLKDTVNIIDSQTIGNTSRNIGEDNVRQIINDTLITGYQSNESLISIVANTHTTAKQFTNLTPGFYMVNYNQCLPVEASGWIYIYLNETAMSTQSGKYSAGTTSLNCTAIVEITNSTDVIKLNYYSDKASSSADRPCRWQIIKLK